MTLFVGWMCIPQGDSRLHFHSNIRFGNLNGWCPLFGACSVTGVLSRSVKRVFSNLVSGISSDFLVGLRLANYALNCCLLSVLAVAMS